MITSRVTAPLAPESMADGGVQAGTSPGGSSPPRAEKIAHASAGMVPIDNRVVSEPTRGGLMRRALRKTNRVAQQLLERCRTSSGPLDQGDGRYTLNPIYVKVRRQRDCQHGYTWGMVQGVHLAKVLGIDRVSAIEFGVAGGRSLMVLERLADSVQSIFGVTVDVYGFDTGVGLPKPVDYRDMPNLWSEGFFKMDVEKLKSRLKRAELVLGPVSDTLPKFLDSQPSPVVFVGFDVDLYSSTRDALALFNADTRLLLPRVHCYFDDILGYSFGDCVGERLAISDFNCKHEERKISPIYGLQYYVPKRFADEMQWEKQYMAHIFDHKLYNQYDGSIPSTGCTWIPPR
jgi:hypothetical protein